MIATTVDTEQSVRVIQINVLFNVEELTTNKVRAVSFRQKKSNHKQYC